MTPTLVVALAGMMMVFTLSLLVIAVLWKLAQQPATTKAERPLQAAPSSGLRLGATPLSTAEAQRIVNEWMKTNPALPAPPVPELPPIPDVQIKRDLIDLASSETRRIVQKIDDKRKARDAEVQQRARDEARRQAEEQRIAEGRPLIKREGPDGKIIQFPAHMSEADVSAAMQKLYPQLRERNR